MSSQTNETSLHGAVKGHRVELIRQLLYVGHCNPATPNVYGKTAAYMYFISLLNRANTCGSEDIFTAEEISCFTEMLWFTYDTQQSVATERSEIFDMLDYCYQFSDIPIRKLFMEIVDVFITPSHHRRYFVDKILEANLSSDYCLIASMFDSTDLLPDTDFVSLRSNFLCESFTLFLANGSFFEEYLAEVMSSGWTFNVPTQSWAFSAALAKHQDIASVFSFMKHLIRYDINFVDFLKRCILQLPAKSADIIGVNVFVPLSNFTNATINLAQILRRVNLTQLSYYNFNETVDVLNDFKALVESESNSFQVVSLQNLARMSIREYVFRSHTHYKGLSLLYSLSNVPAIIRNFLCYNYCNLKF